MVHRSHTKVSVPISAHLSPESDGQWTAKKRGPHNWYLEQGLLESAGVGDHPPGPPVAAFFTWQVVSISFLSFFSFDSLSVWAFPLVQKTFLRQLKPLGQGNSLVWAEGPPHKAFEQLCNLRDTGSNCPQFSQQQWPRTSEAPIRVLSC